MEKQFDIKSSVRLPKTPFEMKANLKILEEKILQQWEDKNVYGQILTKNINSPKFILHDGPPYANGHIHLGHSLNKILKDIIIKANTTMGFYSPFVLGWDCHGLPIEWKIEEEYKSKGIDKKQISVTQFRKQCEEFAIKWVETQTGEFKKLGILADFNNPYLTINKDAEVVIVSSIFELLKSGSIYQGKKPVMWSCIEQTALAEAEVEYKDKKSDTLYASLKIVKSFNDSWLNASCVIWTTTPWTLPSNQAIAYNPNISYGLYEVIGVDGDSLAKKHSKLVLSVDLAPSFFQEIGVSEFKLLDTNNGLNGVMVEHPLFASGYNFIVPAIEGDFVENAVGSGIVHIAPAHGEDDFYVCKKNNIIPKLLILDSGYYSSEANVFAGEHIFKVNPLIIEHLLNNGNLLKHKVIVHSYPHSWRSKAPLIYNLTPQWFISMEHNNLRERAISSLDGINFQPKSGENRLKSMLKTRPDWCISRQRSWGVPLGIFVNVHTNEPLIDGEVFANVIAGFKDSGSDCWFNNDPKRFLTDKYNKEDYKPIMDVLDVWVDSGLSHAYVLHGRDNLSHPCDLYLEGSDQHRGWFQSSLVLSLLLFNKPPFKTILTHGFTLDEKGQKMSKSLGNVMDPLDIINSHGADILRLWVANSNYIEDISFGKNILSQQVECYRKIRNIMKYLLGNLSYDFQRIDQKDMLDVDKWLLHNIFILDDLYNSVFKSTFNIHVFFNKLFNFISLDLSAFYFDIKKDILYCDSNNSINFKSTLSAFEILFEYLLKWLSPFISFTAEEIYQCKYKEEAKDSVFLHDFPLNANIYNNIDNFNKWEKIKKIRKVITGAIELQRASKYVGSSLECSPIVYVQNVDDYTLLKSIDFAEVCITSDITIEHMKNDFNLNKDDLFKLDEIPNVFVKVLKHDGLKCERCWKFHNEMKNKEYNLCNRCANEVK